MPDDATTKPSRRRTPPLRPVGADSTPRPSQRNTRACAHRKTNHEETSRTPRWQLAPRPRAAERTAPSRFPQGTSYSLRCSSTCPTVFYMTGLTQPWHIILILMIALLLFGGRRLPEVGRSLGSGMREFKDSIAGHHPASTSEQLAPPETTALVSQPTEPENH